jgi:hypothetical protein
LRFFSLEHYPHLRWSDLHRRYDWHWWFAWLSRLNTFDNAHLLPVHSSEKEMIQHLTNNGSFSKITFQHGRSLSPVHLDHAKRIRLLYSISKPGEYIAFRIL